MNKSLILATLVFTLTISACQQYTPIESQKQGAVPRSARLDPTSFLADLPAGTEIPSKLPATIDDPLLMEAWIMLYNQQEPVQLWNGNHISGRVLAKIVLTNKVEIQWGAGEICNGNSCNKTTDGQTEIYISAWIKTAETRRLVTLVESVAHELFHYTNPFDQKDDSQFEEFWAYYVASHIAKTSWVRFTGFDSLNPDCLNLWFNSNDLAYYLKLTPYPAKVQAALEASGKGCPCANTSQIPDTAILDGGTCQEKITSNR